MIFQDPKYARASILKATAAFSSSRRGSPLMCYTRIEKGDLGDVLLSTETTHWERAEGIVKEVERQCSTPISRLREVVDAMADEMRAGLESDAKSNLLKMVISYVDTLPTGDEKGLFYALDLGDRKSVV